MAIKIYTALIPLEQKGSRVKVKKRHIKMIPTIHRRREENLDYKYCNMFYDTLFDLLMHGY